jgi:hypothetical protein
LSTYPVVFEGVGVVVAEGKDEAAAERVGVPLAVAPNESEGVGVIDTVEVTLPVLDALIVPEGVGDGDDDVPIVDEGVLLADAPATSDLVGDWVGVGVFVCEAPTDKDGDGVIDGVWVGVPVGVPEGVIVGETGAPPAMAKRIEAPLNCTRGSAV